MHDDSRLTIGPIAATRKMCANGIMAQEQEFLAALGSSTAWRWIAACSTSPRAAGGCVLIAGPESAR